MLTGEKLLALRAEYCSNLENWHEEFGPLERHFKGITDRYWERCRYVVRNLPWNPQKIIACPPASLLNFAPNQQHRTDYATSVWEGSSAEPQLDDNGDIIGVNVILHEPRMQRFKRSLAARGYELAFPQAEFSQMILDAVAINGKQVVMEDNGQPTRAYIRPSVGTGVGAWGVSLRPDSFIESSVIVFRWTGYFANSVRIDNEGLKVVITGARRLFPVTGKHASNYGAAAVDGKLARELGYDELVYLAPYGIKGGQLDYNVNSFEALRQYGTIADGPGEEIIGVAADGKTILYPPMRVNRLGGTVLNYLIEHLLPRLGIKAVEHDLTLEELRQGKIIGLAFVGNAVKVTPIGQLDLVHASSDGNHGEVVEILFKRELHPLLLKIKEQFLGELSGKITPSHASLLTPVDLEFGDKMRETLDGYWCEFIK